jgi:hypothetical protein
MPTQPLNEQQKTNSSNAKTEQQSGKHSAAEPSGPRGDNPGTAGPGHTKVQSPTPENNQGHINPSAPEDANVTPGTAGKK